MNNAQVFRTKVKKQLDARHTQSRSRLRTSPVHTPEQALDSAYILLDAAEVSAASPRSTLLQRRTDTPSWIPAADSAATPGCTPPQQKSITSVRKQLDSGKTDKNVPVYSAEDAAASPESCAPPHPGCRRSKRTSRKQARKPAWYS